MNLSSELEALFDNIKLFARGENFIGTPVKVENITLLPILSLSFGAGGVGSGAGAGGKIFPIALVVIKDEDIRLFSLNGQDTLQEIFGLIAEIISSSKSPVMNPQPDRPHD